MLMKRIVLCLVAAVLSAMGSSIARAHDGHDGPTGRTFTVGKKGDVNIREDVKVGGDILKRGKYLFDHRVDGDRHLIVLTGIVKNDVVPPVYEIATRTIAAREPATKSAFVAKELPDHSLQVGVVRVAGEALEHVPDGATVTVAATR
jgi:hypothetical protein